MLRIDFQFLDLSQNGVGNALVARILEQLA